MQELMNHPWFMACKTTEAIYTEVHLKILNSKNLHIPGEVSRVRQSLNINETSQ